MDPKSTTNFKVHDYEANVSRASLFLYLVVFAALLGPLSIGLVLGYTSPALPSMVRSNGTLAHIAADRESKSWIGSSMALGAIIGGLIAGPVCGIIGRKISITLCNVPFLLGWILIIFANGLGMLVAGRIFNGLGVGFFSGSVPLYIIEISPSSIRGLIGTSFQVALVTGYLVSAIFGVFMEWQLIAIVSAIPCIAMPIAMFFCPETPVYLIQKKGISDDVVRSLKRLRSKESDVNSELAEIEKTPKGNQPVILGWNEIKKPQIYKPLILVNGLFFFSQFTGNSAVMFNQVSIFEKASTGLKPEVSSVITCLAQVLATIAGSFLVDRSGRKLLFLISGTGLTISMALLGFYFFQSANDAVFAAKYGWLALFSLVMYLVLFSIGLGPIPWMMVPELTPFEARSFVSAVGTCFVWILVFILNKFFENMIQGMGNAGTYWFFGGLSFLSIVFVQFLLPETKGKTFEEITALFTN